MFYLAIMIRYVDVCQSPKWKWWLCDKNRKTRVEWFEKNAELIYDVKYHK